MRHFSFYKTFALLFVFASGFSCFFCKSEFKEFKAGELSISYYNLYRNKTLIPIPDNINRITDTLNINLKQDFYSVQINNNCRSNLMACSPSGPEYIDRPDSISVKTLSNFDNQTNANSNINDYCRLFRYNHSIVPLFDYEFYRGYDNINICLIKNPTVDSIKLNIKLFFNDNSMVRSVDTKWLKFN
ncbi:MAG: hypothetical protein HQ463_07640 [Bacteroidetes bacterium]|nr:hypothetical protein [Bacteroidota bacterium]